MPWISPEVVLLRCKVFFSLKVLYIYLSFRKEVEHACVVNRNISIWVGLLKRVPVHTLWTETSNNYLMVIQKQLSWKITYFKGPAEWLNFLFSWLSHAFSISYYLLPLLQYIVLITRMPFGFKSFKFMSFKHCCEIAWKLDWKSYTSWWSYFVFVGEVFWVADLDG